MNPSQPPRLAGLLARAHGYVARQGRPLEHARWGVLAGGTPDLALDVLAEYQNPDGGFGHALEPDFWNPGSTPIQSWVAMEVLREVGCPSDHPLVRGLLGWLEAQWAAGTGLPSVVPGNNDHPHAPWWAYDEAGGHSNHSEWNPQAALAGFAWGHAPAGSRVEALARDAVTRGLAALETEGTTFDPHVVACFVTLAEELAAKPGDFDLEALEGWLNALAEALVEPDPDRWFTTYCCRPSQLVRAPGRWSARLEDLARLEAEALVAAQDEEGSWPVTWSWEGETWPVARTWWRGVMAVQNARFVKTWLE